MKTIGERFDEMAETAGVSKIDKCYYFGRSCCFQIATEQKAIDIDRIPQLYVRWLMIDGDKPSWEEYANKALKKQI